MKKRNIAILIIIVVIVTVVVSMVIFRSQNKNIPGKSENETTNQVKNNSENIVEESSIADGNNNKNEVASNDVSIIKEIKESTGATGDDDIYQVANEYDNRKILTVKSSVQYKVALCGFLQNEKFELSQVDKIINEKTPKNSGIWIEESSREDIQELLEQISKSEYEIKDGYLTVKNANSENDVDKVLKKYIDSDKFVVLAKTGDIKMVDDVTGTVEDYPFEKLEEYQSYDFVQDNGNYIICLAKNEKGKIQADEFAKALKSILN